MLTTIFLITFIQLKDWFRRTLCKIGIHNWVRTIKFNQDGWTLIDKVCKRCNKKWRNDN